MTTARLMTAEEAFCYCVNKHPGLYASLDEHSTRMRVYDQLFNVLGNGCSDEYGLAKQFTWTIEKAHLCMRVPAKYMGPKDVFEGFTDIIEDHDEPLGWRPKYASRIPALCTHAEQEFYPEVRCWTLRAKGHGFAFSPNFKEAFTLVYNVNLDTLDISWLHAAHYYYSEAKMYFANEKCRDTYSGAWPSNTVDQNLIVQRLENDFVGKTPQQVQELWARISTNYGVAYRGDTALFLQNVWEREWPRIQRFVNNTVALLDQHLAVRAAQSQSLENQQPGP